MAIIKVRRTYISRRYDQRTCSDFTCRKGYITSTKSTDTKISQVVRSPIQSKYSIPFALTTMREISFLIKAHLLAARVRKLFISAAMTTGGAVQILRKSLQDAHKTLEFSNDALKRLTGRYPAVQP